MKILIILPNNAHGGAEQYLKMIASYFKKEEVSIIFLRKRESNFWNDIENITVQSYISKKSEAIGFLKFATKAFLSKQQHYDYIFTSHVYINGLIGFLLNLSRIKTKKFIARESTSIFLRYKGFSRYVYKLMYRFGYKKMNLLICQTELMKNQLVKYLPYISKRTKISVIPNPIDLNLIETKSKENIDFKIESEYIVSAGRLITEKGFDVLINAFNIIKKQNPKLKLVILGNGQLKNDLQELSKSLNIEQDIEFAGHVHNVYPYFKHAKICVVSSRIEGFPNVLLQMMSQNSNVVSTLCAGGIDDIPGVITTKTNDAKLLSIAMEQCLDQKNQKENKTIFSNFLKTRDINHFIKTILDN